MKYLTRTCHRCGTQKTFRGENVDEILKAMDDINWRDMPSGKDVCSACEEEWINETEADLDYY